MLHVETSIRDVNTKSGLQRIVTDFMLLTIISFILKIVWVCVMPHAVSSCEWSRNAKYLPSFL